MLAGGIQRRDRCDPLRCMRCDVRVGRTRRVRPGGGSRSWGSEKSTGTQAERCSRGRAGTRQLDSLPQSLEVGAVCSRRRGVRSSAGGVRTREGW